MIWSAVLTVMGITGLWLAGSGKKAGWMVGLIAQILWIGYALVTRQYPFIVSALVYGFVYMRNYNKSTSAPRPDDGTTMNPPGISR